MCWYLEYQLHLAWLWTHCSWFELINRQVVSSFFIFGIYNVQTYLMDNGFMIKKIV